MFGEKDGTTARMAAEIGITVQDVGGVEEREVYESDKNENAREEKKSITNSSNW